MSIEEQEVILQGICDQIAMRRMIDQNDPALPALVADRDSKVLIYAADGGEKWYGY